MKPLDNAIGHASSSAVTLLKDRKKAIALLDAAIRRLRSEQRFFDMKGLAVKMHAAVRLVRMTVSRGYRDVPWRSIVLITTGLVYFVSPADAIPDFIPMLGLTDDAALLAAIFSSVKHDLDRFLEWEKSQEGSEDERPPQE
ncbi:MAG: DUF1232 domain-containing protein [Chlorobiaceae bacterium]|nr:DUF1232 domain-containing protein [Chlorobiaceae bacterium]